ncbi:hypothetical protein [Vibrio harveyi]|uniref:hypothetical protein n=1 Tax=Vibrio harveyi TaxID=669 RepID=UPI003CF78504
MEKTTNYWLENSINTILDLSISLTFAAACAEWHFTGKVIDHEKAEAVCELCGKNELRYHYEIRNGFTDHELMVGSSCILRFSDIRVLNQHGCEVTDHGERERLLRDALERERIESLLAKLRVLYRSNRRGDMKPRIANLAILIKQKEKLTPKDAAWLVHTMAVNGITHDTSLISVSLNKKKHKSELANLPPYAFNLVWDLLTATQQERHKFLHLEKNRKY